MSGPGALEHFSSLDIAITAAIYTWFAFMGGYSRPAMVFRKRNAVPTSTILSEHLKFLTILLVLMLTVTWLYPNLPEWSKEIWYTGRSGRWGLSGVDLGFLLAMATMLQVERRRIYVEAETESEDTQ
jgi:hypothetical protein